MKRIIAIILLLLTCSAAAMAQGTITTTHPSGLGVCISDTCLLTDSVSGGTWSSSNPGIATINVAGYVTGLSAGTTTITYTIAGGLFTTATFYVSAAPAAISGTGTICVGAGLTLTDITAGGSWTSDGTVASVNSVTGDVNGVSAGDQLIYYVTGTGCYATTYVAVNDPIVVSPITGPATVCVGFTIPLTDSVTGGVWTCAPPSIATIDSTTGVVTAVAAGAATIDYTYSGTCGISEATTDIVVTAGTASGLIMGSGIVYLGTPITLSNTVSGGVWSSDNTAIATIDTSGTVTGVSTGTATISYTVTGCTGPASTTFPITVAVFNGISGNIVFTGPPDSDAVQVWLIHYNSSTFELEAIDSTVVYATGSSAYYQFGTTYTDSFRIKAAPICSCLATGYLPTYHTSSFYWHDANVIFHTSGIIDTGENIIMAYGSTTSGPGFIGGNVTTGANKGTSTSVPVTNLRMVVMNTITSAIVQYTYTDLSGAYLFEGLPYGTYAVFPDSLNYVTTPYSGIILSASTPNAGASDFIQHTVSKTITPINETAVGLVNTPVTSVFTFPSPTSGKLHIQWQEATAEKGTLSVTDITGREVYTDALNMNEGNGTTTVDLSGLNNGLYMVSLKSTTVNYNTKIEVLR